MKKNILKLLFFLFLAGIMSPAAVAQQQSITLSTYYPSPTAVYQEFKLAPLQVAPPCSTADDYGKLYYDKGTNEVKFCKSSGWVSIAGPDGLWERDSANSIIYPTNLNDFVGIGTATPQFMLSLKYDLATGMGGNILAKGIHGLGNNLVTASDGYWSPVIQNPPKGGARFIWYPKLAAFRAGYVHSCDAVYSCPGVWDPSEIGDYSVALGTRNRAKGIYSVILGGIRNSASSPYSFSGGGFDNRVSASYATFVGGINGNLMGNWGSIGGNIGASNVYEKATKMAGGRTVDVGDYSFSGGGDANDLHKYEVAIGGYWNRTSASATPNFNTLAGGSLNTINSKYGTISGGRENINGSPYDYATISGGYLNTITGIGATISGGQNNQASGSYSMVPGGGHNLAGGDYSLAAGRYMQLDPAADYSFIWGYDSSAPAVAPSSNDSFLIFPYGNAGNVSIGMMADPSVALAVNGNLKITGLPVVAGDDLKVDASGIFCKFASSIRYKTNIKPLAFDIKNIILLKPVEFKWKKSGQKDVGLIAEDVEALIPDLVIYDKEGKPDAVKYDRVVLYLLELVKEWKATNEELKEKIATLEGR